MTKRDQTRRANAAPLWKERRDLAKRSPVDAPVVAFDLVRKQVKAIRDQSAQNAWWARLAALLTEFGTGVHHAAECSQEAGICEVHSPEPRIGSETDPGARPRARESTGGHGPSATLEGES